MIHFITQISSIFNTKMQHEIDGGIVIFSFQ